MQPGDIIEGRFEILREVAAGGMGRILQARDRQTGAVIALKLIVGDDAAFAERFIREAVVLADITHPGVVKYIAHGITSSGENYLAMAEDNDAYTAPVGMAWKQVRDTHPGLQLYVGDGSHPSVQGTYLAACVFYCTLFQQPCTGASYTGMLSADTAAILQGIASATVLDSMALWNLDLPEGIGAAITGSTSSAWNTVTFHHSGTGTHLWTCSDGQTSTDANPTFTVDTPGTYTFTHTYTDPCGNTDTATWTYDFIVSGIDPGAIQDGITVTATEGTIVLRGAAGGDTLTIYDLAGRAVIAVVRGNGTLTVPSSPGVRIWSLHRSNGERISGRVVVQ